MKRNPLHALTVSLDHKRGSRFGKKQYNSNYLVFPIHLTLQYHLAHFPLFSFVSLLSAVKVGGYCSAWEALKMWLRTGTCIVFLLEKQKARLQGAVTSQEISALST